MFEITWADRAWWGFETLLHLPAPEHWTGVSYAASPVALIVMLVLHRNTTLRISGWVALFALLNTAMDMLDGGFRPGNISGAKAIAEALPYTLAIGVYAVTWMTLGAERRNGEIHRLREMVGRLRRVRSPVVTRPAE